MASLWRLIGRYWFDAVVVGLVALGLVGMFASDPEDRPTISLWVAIPGLLAIIAPLFVRRQFPFVAPAATLVAAAITSFIDNNIPGTWPAAPGAALFACVLFALANERREAIVGLAIAVGSIAIVLRNDLGGADDMFFGALIFSVAWMIGFAFNRKRAEAAEAEERAARAEREREDRALAAVADERARIARELHDLVGHSVSLMTVQTGAVRRLLRPDQDREREALEIVEHTGRQALAEMRRVVGVLRRPEEAPALAPQPSLEYLDALVAHVRAAGLAVELRVEGQATQLPPGIDLTAYRLVQEGLTNSLKHARATKANVVVRYGDDDVEILVSDDGRGAGSGDGGGHGLVGMRERVSVYGGELEAGPRAGGGFALRARLPLGEQA